VAVNVALVAAYVLGRILWWTGLRSDDISPRGDDESVLARFSVHHVYISVLVACRTRCATLHAAAGLAHANALLLLLVVLGTTFCSTSASSSPSTTIILTIGSLLGAVSAAGCGLVLRLVTYVIVSRCCLTPTTETDVDTLHDSSSSWSMLSSDPRAAVATPPLPKHTGAWPAAQQNSLSKQDAYVVSTRPSSGDVRSLRELFENSDESIVWRPSSHQAARRFTTTVTQEQQGGIIADDVDDVIDLDAMSMHPMAPLHITEFETSHGSATSSRASSSKRASLSEGAGVPVVEGEGGGWGTLADAAMEDIEIPSDLFEGDIDVESLATASTSSSENRRMSMSHVERGVRPHGLRGGGREGSKTNAKTTAAAPPPPTSSAVDATTGRLMWIPDGVFGSNAADDEAAIDGTTAFHDATGVGWFGTTKDLDEEDYYYVFEEEGTVHDHSDARRHCEGDDDYVASFFAEDDNSLGEANAATEVHRGKKNRKELTNPDEAEVTLDKKEKSSKKKGNLTAEKATKTKSNHSGDDATTDETNSFSSSGKSESCAMRYEHVFSFLLATAAAILLAILLFGASSYPPEVSGAMVLGVVLDAVIGQSLFAGGAVIIAVKCC
ncbi:GPI-anchored surface protein, putative, partial [Bodo saltans]